MSSRVKTFACALVVGLIPLAAWSAEEAKAPGKQYNVVEVSLFDVNRKDFATKEAERAGSIPDDVIEKIQRSLIGIVTRSGDFPAVRKPGDAAAEGESVLSVTGRVTDYKAGNRAARMFVGMGAGAQKLEVECVLKDKSSGDVLAKDTIVDRKWAGFAGGSEDKGMEDFAEKLQQFIKKTVNPE